jgi:membrane carboxypeptidase/penicillin-binding protein PbpC
MVVIGIYMVGSPAMESTVNEARTTRSESSCKKPFVHMTSPASSLHHDMSVMMDTYIRLQSLVPKAVVGCVREQGGY